MSNSNSLSVKIARYSAMAASLVGITNMQGQVVYTDIEPDFVHPGSGEVYLLDLDNNGTPDYKIDDLFGGVFNIDRYSSNEFVAYFISSGDYTFVKRFEYSEDIIDAISSDQTAWLGTTMGVIRYTTSYYGCIGQFCDDSEAFVGLRFFIDGTLHYGWLRVESTDFTWTLKDYAYSADPEFGLKAGTLIEVPLVLSNQEQALDAIEVIRNSDHLQINGLQEQTSYTLYSITGQKVSSGAVNEQNNKIEVSGYAKGLYVLELRDIETLKTIRKKVVIR